MPIVDDVVSSLPEHGAKPHDLLRVWTGVILARRDRVRDSENVKPVSHRSSLLRAACGVSSRPRLSLINIAGCEGRRQNPPDPLFPMNLGSERQSSHPGRLRQSGTVGGVITTGRVCAHDEGKDKLGVSTVDRAAADAASLADGAFWLPPIAAECYVHEDPGSSSLDHLANVGSSGCMKVKADGIGAEGSAVGPRDRRPCNFALGTKYAPSALRFVRLVPHARAGR